MKYGLSKVIPLPSMRCVGIIGWVRSDLDGRGRTAEGRPDEANKIMIGIIARSWMMELGNIRMPRCHLGGQ